MATVTVQGGEFAFGSTVVTRTDTTVPLVDSVTSVGGDGSYYISLTSANALVVTRINGIAPPNETSDFINLASVSVQRGGSGIYINDLRNRNVTNATVNQAIMHAVNADGSPVRDSMVTPRTFSPAAIAFILSSGNVKSGTAFPASPLPGQRFYRTDLNQLYVFQGGTWVAVTGAVGSSATSFPGSPYDGQIIFRTDLAVLYVFIGGEWVALGSTAGVAGAGIIIGAGPPGSIEAPNGTIYEDALDGGLDYIASDVTVGAHGTYSSDQIRDGAIAQWPLADSTYGSLTPIQTAAGGYTHGVYIGTWGSPGTSLLGDQPQSPVFQRANVNSAQLPFQLESLSVWSIEFVANPTDGNGTSGSHIAGDDHTDVTNKGLYCIIADNSPGIIEWVIGTGSATFIVGPYTAGANFTGATEYHIVLTYDGTTYRFYVNGALVSSVTGAAPATPTAFTGIFHIGDTPNVVSHVGLDGSAAGVGLYSTVLTGAEILSHFNDMAAATGSAGVTTTTWNAILTAGGGSGVSSFNTRTGAIIVQGDGSTATVTESPTNTFTVASIGSGGVMPLTNGDLPGPGIMADAFGQCIAVPYP